MRLAIVIGLLAVVLTLGGMTALGDSGTAGNGVYLELRPGWNQVVWFGETQTADATLSDLSGLQAAYGWSNEDQAFSQYLPDRAGANTLKNLATGGVYWIVMGTGDELKLRSLDFPPGSWTMACEEVRKVSVTMNSFIEACPVYCDKEAADAELLNSFLEAFCN